MDLELSSCGSHILEHKPSSCGTQPYIVGSVASGIFPDQGLNPCLLNWQADSLPLSHQGSSRKILEIQIPSIPTRHLWSIGNSAKENWSCVHFPLLLPPTQGQRNPGGASAFVPQRGWVWENVWDQKALSPLELGSCSERLSGSSQAELAWSPGRLRLGLRQVLWQQPDLRRCKTRARKWQQLRRKTGSEKIAS